LPRFRVDDLNRRLEEIAVEHKRASDAWANRERQIMEHIEKQESMVHAVEAGIDLKAEALLAAAEKAVSVAEERVAGAQARARAVQEQIAVTRKALEDSMQAKAEEVAVREKITKLENEISEWSYIRDACSKTGLQALEIDGVCPAITCDSNNLLTQTFGTGFSVRIETKDESGREVFKDT